MKTPKQKKPKSPLPEKQLFSYHLGELRSRITWCILAFIIGSVVGYFLHQPILEILIEPLNQPIFYTSPAGGFNFVLNISLFFGFLVSLPICIYNAIRFAEPALPKKYPNLIIYTLTVSTNLMLIGMSFAYFISLPAALYFLNNFATSEVKSLISTTEYFKFVTRYLVGFGLVFQLPLIMLLINSVKPIPMKTLLRFEKWVIIISFLIAAILTPTPDFLNQTIMALPIIILYQFTIGLLWVVNKKR